MPSMMGGMMGGSAARGQLHARDGSSLCGRPDRLPAGALVRLTDLKAGGSERNGALGRIERFDEPSSRYVVSLDGTFEQLKLRPQNVRQVLAEARVVGVKGEASLNGRVASSATYDASSKRYKCEGLKGDHTVVALKPENVVLPRACRVVVDGVQSRPQLNGRLGEVLDVVSDRYVVKLGDETLRLRFGAVVAC